MYRALIVDDEPHIRQVGKWALDFVGCAVVEATNGREAWQAIQKQLPDVLISDIKMPELDGIELVRLIRETPETQNLPIIIISAQSLEFTAEEESVLASCQVIEKPFSPSRLAREVQAVFDATHVPTA